MGEEEEKCFGDVALGGGDGDLGGRDTALGGGRCGSRGWRW